MSDSYVASRNIADYTYMFRCQEYQGYLACGTGNTGRGIFQTAALKSIDGIRSVKVSFDFCYQYGSTDLLLFQVVNGGMIASASVDGKSIALTADNSGYTSASGRYIVEKSHVTLPSSEAAVKKWHNVEVVVNNATDGTMLYWAGNDVSSGVHGFYVDNIEVRALGEMGRGSDNLRVLYWNIQNGMWSDQANNYNNFVAWVKKYDPDICVWCESATIYKDNTNSAQASSARFLPDGWAALAARYGHAYTAVGGWRDNYPQTITSKYPIETLLKITDSDQAGKPVSHGAAIQRVTVKGRTINIVTLHTWPQAYGFGVGSADQAASAANKEGDKYREFEIKYICAQTVNNPAYASCQDWRLQLAVARRQLVLRLSRERHPAAGPQPHSGPYRPQGHHRRALPGKLHIVDLRQRPYRLHVCVALDVRPHSERTDRHGQVDHGDPEPLRVQLLPPVGPPPDPGGLRAETVDLPSINRPQINKTQS